jgi:predicted HAD superfamily Cof-like phosphohydrolase
MFEKGREYVVQQTEDYMWLTSEFIQGHELNENLLKYFKPKEEKKDPIVESVVNKFLERSKVGIEKYGTTLNDNNKDNFITHAMEEAMDFTLYLQKLQSQQKESIIQKVKDFNKAFKIPYSIVPVLNKDERLLRFKLMQEENTEYLEAKTIEDVADALGDQLYVLVGTILKHGLQDVIFDVFNEIHESNMSKLENGKALHREDGKILKGKNYFKPNLKQFFNK